MHQEEVRVGQTPGPSSSARRWRLGSEVSFLIQLSLAKRCAFLCRKPPDDVREGECEYVIHTAPTVPTDSG